MHYRLFLMPVAALVAVIGITAAVWARAPLTPTVDWRRMERICAANGGLWERTTVGGACIDTDRWLLD
jgi:hypothetical protein